jgi:biotin-dependent carboxylase-like uncharacterized protein
MSAIVVQAPGLLTTVQDLGRPGYGPSGVSASGAADALALRAGNRLIGNAEGAAGLEMTLLGGAFLFPDGAVLALTGSDFGATLDGATVERWTSVGVKPGQTLKLGPTKSGARCTLCVRGGIAVKPFLGSASTHLLSGLGGHEGRALRKGDVLEIGPSPSKFRKRKMAAQSLERLAPRKVLRVTDGPQNEWFSDVARREFLGNTYRVAEKSNRMGIRLQGATIARGPGDETAGGEMISEGVSLGAIQVPESGMPIILFVEQQTTGGYPKIANVISADFHSLGQLRPRDEVRFARVSLEMARALLMEQEKLLASEELIAE